MKNSQDRFDIVSNFSASEIYRLEKIMWREQGLGVIDPKEILDNQLKQGVIKHLNQKYGQ